MTIGKNPLYHFTDIRNIPSIKAHGLLCLAQLKLRGIAPVLASNDWSRDADVRVGLHNYVHLCFFQNHPMEYEARTNRGVNSKFLTIKPEILQWEAVRLTLAVANERGAELLTLSAATERMDIEVMCNRVDFKNSEIQNRRQAVEKYEILVPNAIPVEFIIRGL